MRCPGTNKNTKGWLKRCDGEWPHKGKHFTIHGFEWESLHVDEHFEMKKKAIEVAADYNTQVDREKLVTQLDRIKEFMLLSGWKSLREIADLLKYSESSVSAQLRHLRKPRFGSYVVSRRRRGDRKSGLFEYKVREQEKL